MVSGDYLVDLAAGNGYLMIGNLDKGRYYFQRNNALFAKASLAERRNIPFKLAGKY